MQRKTSIVTISYFQELIFLVSKMMNLILVSLVATALLYTPTVAQTSGTCPGGAGSCNCQLNNVESLRALIRNEVQAEVETEVAARLAATPGIYITTVFLSNNGQQHSDF